MIAEDEHNGVRIPTARGDTITSAELGFTLMHEHTFNISTEINMTYPETWGDEDARVEGAIGQYQELKAAGVDTIVDVTVIGLGRYIPRIRRIANEVDLNIIVATGIYTWHELPMFFKFIDADATVAGGLGTMEDLFVSDIEQGIGNSGIRAALLKVATDKYGVTEGVERVLRATARAHRRTGVPITTHTHDTPNGLDQQRVFREEGVDLARVVIGHMDFASGHDLGYVENIIDNGSFVGFDQFGVPIIEDEVRVNSVAELCKRGYAERIVLSHDHNCFCDMVPADWYSEQNQQWRKTYISSDILPQLRECGVTDAQIEQMTRVNPRRVFETAGMGSY